MIAAQLNQIIVWSSNQRASAKFLAEMLGRPAPTRFGHLDVVELDNGVSLDFADAEDPIRPQHYAFLIGEADFDAVARIKDRGFDYWADPRGNRPGEINHNDGGRGVYFREALRQRWLSEGMHPVRSSPTSAAQRTSELPPGTTRFLLRFAGPRACLNSGSGCFLA